MCTILTFKSTRREFNREDVDFEEPPSADFLLLLMDFLWWETKSGEILFKSQDVYGVQDRLCTVRWRKTFFWVLLGIISLSKSRSHFQNVSKTPKVLLCTPEGDQEHFLRFNRLFLIWLCLWNIQYFYQTIQ